MQYHDNQNLAVNRGPSCTYVQSLTDHFEQDRSAGRKLYFVTVTYLESKSHPLTPERASRNLAVVYSRFRRHLCRHSGRTWFRKIEPKLFAYLDRPFSKPKHYDFEGAPKHESTYHHHCIMAVDPRHIARIDALTDKTTAAVFASKLKDCAKLRTIDVQEIGSTRGDIERVVDYSSYWARQRLDQTHVLEVYPKAVSEVGKQAIAA